MPPKRKKKEKSKKLLPFSWYGGKFVHLNWLLPLLPKCYHYCEPFGGSGAVLLNRKPSPIETYNDLDGEIVNFFKILRNDTHKLIELLELTPFSREEFIIACKCDINLSNLERARRFFVKARQVRGGFVQKASAGLWAYKINRSSNNISGTISAIITSIKGLPFVIDRLLKVQIENKPAIDILKRYDSKNTLFYCDPPYIHSTRGDSKVYKYEMTNNEHVLLADTLNNIIGMVAISGYNCDLMKKLYPKPKWYSIYKNTVTRTTGKRSVETLWVNYKLEK